MEQQERNLAVLEVQLACVRLSDRRAERVPARWREALGSAPRAVDDPKIAGIAEHDVRSADGGVAKELRLVLSGTES